MRLWFVVFLVTRVGLSRGDEINVEQVRDDFPRDFVFGSGTSAYQVEGAAAGDGKLPSIWDTFAHNGRCQAHGGDEVISWSRLITNGRGDINPTCLEYYNNLIDELIGHGIQPHVTLFHYDLPQILEDEYQGWLSPRIVDDFTAYADVCFREFGDRVSYWTTLNEPNVVVVAEAKQQGSVGINIFTYHFMPKNDAMEDVLAAKRSQEFYAGWFRRPLVYGDYPDIMKKLVSQKLPKFSRNQSRELVGAFDFIGVNYYSTLAAKDNPSYVPQDQRDCMNDSFAKLSVVDRGESGTKILTAYGLQGVLEYFKQTYGNPPIYIHENGYPLPHNETLDDTPRVRYLSAHIASLLNAIRNGSNTLGYFTWSFLDVFELMDGYKSSYGMKYVDFGDRELKRYPKLSAHWYSHFLKRGRSVVHENSSSVASTASYQ